MLDLLRTLLAKLITALDVGRNSLRDWSWLWLASTMDSIKSKIRREGVNSSRRSGRHYPMNRDCSKPLENTPAASLDETLAVPIPGRLCLWPTFQLQFQHCFDSYVLLPAFDASD
jgi:hypothetical protein